jgi:inner membrane protein
MVFPAAFGNTPILFAMAGAVIPDLDIVLAAFSDRDPRLFIFSHGGFTHSVTGALVAATGAWLAGAGMLHLTSPLLVLVLFMAWAGALSHLFLDALAYPGIPLLYPYTDRKFTLGVFPGPSLVLFGTSLAFLGLWLGKAAGQRELALYAVFVASFILASGGLKVYMARKSPGRTIPSFHPFRWLELRETPGAWEVWRWRIGREPEPAGRFLKTAGVDPGSLEGIEDLPEVRRLRYYSYTVVAEREGDGIIIRDPLREEGYLFYPMAYTRVLVQAPIAAAVPRRSW